MSTRSSSAVIRASVACLAACLAILPAAVLTGCTTTRRRRARRRRPEGGDTVTTRGPDADGTPSRKDRSAGAPGSDAAPAPRPAAPELPFAEVEPDPVQWEQEPHAYTSVEVVMKARALGGPGKEIEYRFECTSGGGHSSDWQAEASYKDKGLAPRTEYAYVARARDKATAEEVAPLSRPVSVTTRAAERGRGVESTHVAAIDKAIAEGTLEVTPIMLNGDKDNRINIIVIGRWTKGQRNAYNTPERRDEFL
ncbi:MAG: hypothetical protein ACYTKD_28915, partial [Planctomycetota bacterium]